MGSKITLGGLIHSLRTVMHMYSHAYAHVIGKGIGGNPQNSMVFTFIQKKYLVEKIIFHNPGKKVGKSVILCE
jgi:hypothetical protein